MTEEEIKAKEIYDKMKGFRVKNSHRKKCALVAVDLIIEELDNVDYFGCYNWKLIRLELEKL